MLALKPVASVALILLIFNVNYITAEYDVAKYCQLVPKKTLLPSFKNCQTFYTCQDSNTIVESKCPGTDVFDKDKQSCIPRDQSDCLYGVSNPCDGKNGTFSKDPKECRLWHYCLNGKSINSGFCNKGQYFNGEMCVNGPCPIENQNVPDGQVTEVTNICNIMQLNEFFGDFDDCKKWQKCSKTNENPRVGNCLNDLVYDVESRMCLAFKAELCTRTGGVVKPTPNEPTGTCNNGEKNPDSKICSIYYECKEGSWTKQKCDNNKYFDTEKKECVDRQEATPVKTCDRCEFSTTQWVNAVDSNCTKYLTCKNGHRVGDTGSCGLGNYFNEQKQVCLIGNTNLGTYNENNGACSNTLKRQIEDCENDECKKELCKNSDEEICGCIKETEPSLKCKFEACKNDDGCKKAVCKDKNDQICRCINEEHPSLECKLEACKDNVNCKLDVCNDYTEASDKVTCKQTVCNEKDLPEKLTCKENACNDHENPSDIVTCKQTVCNEKDPSEKLTCKENACNDASDKVTCKQTVCNEKDPSEKLTCKFDACEGDPVCEEEVCNGQTEEPCDSLTP